MAVWRGNFSIPEFDGDDSIDSYGTPMGIFRPLLLRFETLAYAPTKRESQQLQTEIVQLVSTIANPLEMCCCC